MEKYNIIAIVYENELLMCKRSENPYKGLYNLVGGKIENEDFLNEAYRELYEETSIKKSDVKLDYLMNLTYIKDNLELQLFYGKILKKPLVKEEKNKLEWISINENFCNQNKFAGEGSLHHIMEIIKLDM